MKVTYMTDIVVGATYRCIDDYGCERVRKVLSVDGKSYIPDNEKTVFYEDGMTGGTGRLYKRTFLKQAQAGVTR